MKPIFISILATFAVVFSSSSLAHPHAFIDMQSKPLVQDNQLQGFSMKWTLDEASSAAVLYDMQQAQGDKQALQKLIDDVIANVENEHYFSYLYDNKGKIKYKRKAVNYGANSNGTQLQYYFDFLLAQPQPLQNNTFSLQTYDETYYVAMEYSQPFDKSVDFSALPKNCKGKVIIPDVNENTKIYAASLDKTQRDEDHSLGEVFAQKVQIQCE